MADREQVLKALRACSPSDTIWCQMREKGDCDFAGAYCMVQLLRDAAELLTPRVLDLNEIPEHDGAVFIEYDPEDMTDEWMLFYAEHKPYLEFVNAREGRVYLATGAYNNIWRAWTSRPSDAQREAEPWKEVTP